VWRWKITTRKGREIEIEAPYITESEVKLISALLDAILDELEKYELEFEFEISPSPGGRQTVRARGKFKRPERGGAGEG
jgi:hypothetical protein